MSDLDMPPPSYAAATGAPVASTQTNQFVHNRQFPATQPSAPLLGDEKLPVPQPIPQPMPQPMPHPMPQPMPPHGWNPHISNPTYTPTPAVPAPEPDTTSITWKEMITDECTPRVLLGYFLIVIITTLLMGFIALGAIYKFNVYLLIIISCLGIALVLYIGHKFVNKCENWNSLPRRRHYY